MSLRPTFFKVDLDPRVATSLLRCQYHGQNCAEVMLIYQTVATPYFRLVKTVVTVRELQQEMIQLLTVVRVEHRVTQDERKEQRSFVGLRTVVDKIS